MTSKVKVTRPLWVAVQVTTCRMCGGGMWRSHYRPHNLFSDGLVESCFWNKCIDRSIGWVTFIALQNCDVNELVAAVENLRTANQRVIDDVSFRPRSMSLCRYPGNWVNSGSRSSAACQQLNQGRSMQQRLFNVFRVWCFIDAVTSKPVAKLDYFTHLHMLFLGLKINVWERRQEKSRAS